MPLQLRCRMATQTGVGGFNLYAGGHQFNAQPIPVHRGTTYHYNVRAHLPLSRVDASFKLHVLLRKTPGPVALPSGVTATAVAAGQVHSLAIGSDGKIYSWGNNYYGQLGNGTTTTSLTPVAITLSNGVTATAIGAGFGHSLAIGSDGKTYAWGFNNVGQLGNGTTTDSHTPLAVNLPAGKTSLVLGTGSEASYSLAILTSAPTAAILSGFHVVHAGNALSFHWRVASGAGLRGFFLTAGTHRLNRLLIALDAHQQSYAFVSRWQGHGPYLLPGGAVVTLASTG